MWPTVTATPPDPPASNRREASLAPPVWSINEGSPIRASDRSPLGRGRPVWSTFGPHAHRNRAVPSGHQRYIVRAGGRGDPGKHARVQNPDKDEVPGPRRAAAIAMLGLGGSAGRPRRRRLAAAAPRREVERWPLRHHRQGCRRSSMPREIRRVAGRLRMARTGFPPTPGSRRRGSVDDRPRYGGRAACPPVPSDSPSLETHKEARRPALSGGTSARLAAAPCAPFLPTIPHMGDDPTPIGNECHPAFYTASQPPYDHAERLDNDTRAMSDGVFAG